MAEPPVVPYGAWKSPITAERVAASALGLGQIALAGGAVYWVENRPAEGGRATVVCRALDGTTRDVIPPPFNVRTRVHEYGGGALMVGGGLLCFANFADQRLYVMSGGAPRPVTPPDDLRYADGVVDSRRRRLIAVREDHRAAGQEPLNTLVSLDLDGMGEGRVLAAGYDFYAAPRLSPDGSRLCWLSWSHPQMPWDGTELWLATIGADGSLHSPRRVAGGPQESVFQPEWSPDGVLHFISDRNGWWNLYRWHEEQARCLTPIAAELGRPQWVLGLSTYGFESPRRIILTYSQAGTSRLASLDTDTLALREITTPYSELAEVRVAPGEVVVSAASPTLPWAIVRITLTDERLEVLRRASETPPTQSCLSIPRPLAFATGGGDTAYGYYYAPHNEDNRAPQGTRPPLLVRSHGGPTASASTALDLAIQFWTSRGLAVLDVNYRGSTGYGRDYRQSLAGRWGVADVEDCVSGAQHLVQQGEVDGRRLLIRGSSAGGFTTLCALTFRDAFRAGASYYGVSDLEALARETHKFESRYLDTLVGPYPACADLYRERSPIHHARRLSCPVIFLQGLDDRVVPPDQAEAMVAVLRARGMPVAYVPFPGEQHGFRNATNIRKALEAELYFYGRVLGLTPADSLAGVIIENLTGHGEARHPRG